MRKIIILLTIFLSALASFAQNAELNALADIVMALQGGGEKAYKSAVARLAKDSRWTPMDELGFNRDIECRASERVPGFKLNSVMTNAENANRYQTTTADHLNGADSRFNYSLYEKTLKAGKTASFELHERWGDQVFLIIPYSGKSAKISAKASSDTQVFAQTAYGSGGIKLEGKATKGKPLKISVTNGSDKPISYVIINYNSRK